MKVAAEADFGDQCDSTGDVSRCQRAARFPAGGMPPRLFGGRSGLPPAGDGLLHEARKLGLPTLEGLGMLVYQRDFSLPLVDGAYSALCPIVSTIKRIACEKGSVPRLIMESKILGTAGKTLLVAK